MQSALAGVVDQREHQFETVVPHLVALLERPQLEFERLGVGQRAANPAVAQHRVVFVWLAVAALQLAELVGWGVERPNPNRTRVKCLRDGPHRIGQRLDEGVRTVVGDVLLWGLVRREHHVLHPE